MWQELWRLISTKLVFTSSYNPHSDPAERANKQILEALRAAVTTVARYDEWDTALPYICFGLNTHISQATGTSPFELVHGFRARVPLEVGAETLPIQHDLHALDLRLGTWYGWMEPMFRIRFRASWRPDGLGLIV